MDSRTSVRPIKPQDLGAVGQFLSAYLNSRITTADWIPSVTRGWASEVPNYGMQLMANDRIVGAFLAIYSEQIIRGRVERFCNPHSWCVLPEHRRDAIKLATAIIRQPGYHFCMLTPNPSVEAVFRFMKFRDLDARLVLLPNWPCPTTVNATDDPVEIRGCLRGQALDDYEQHKTIPWLKHLVVSEGGAAACWLTFKLRTFKRLSCADILGLSDPSSFRRCLPAVRNYLLLRAGALVTRVEARFLDAVPGIAYLTSRTQSKLYLSETLGDRDMRDLYSELVALDL